MIKNVNGLERKLLETETVKKKNCFEWKERLII